MRLYDDSDSGNSYKVRLVLAQIGIPYELVPIDIEKGESRTAAFLAKNPNGRVPVLELDDGRYLAESNAILCHLAEGTALMPASAFDRRLPCNGSSSSNTTTNPMSRPRAIGCATGI